MAVIKVLHLASFEGNIGDNANHYGSRMILKQNLSFSLEYTELEIRHLYWKMWSFDREFVDLANQHDLVIIGGGNYFELWVPDSFTGTTINIAPETLERIKTPMLFYGLGCDVEKGIGEGNLIKFKRFLDHLLGSDRYLVSLRNDGSLDTIRKYLGTQYADKIYRIADGGFFTQTEDHYHPEIPTGKKLLAINVAGDMLDIRYKQDEPNKISYKDFVKEFTDLINKKLAQNEQMHLVFVPHIFRDYQAINDVLNCLIDKYNRERVTVAPYLHGSNSHTYILDLYRKSDLVLGTRFHANVCPIGLNIPTIGLVNYPKIDYLYQELGISGRAIRINQAGFSNKLEELIDNSFIYKNDIKKEYSKIRETLLYELNAFHDKINDWLLRLC